jgi:myosin heavy subunit
MASSPSSSLRGASVELIKGVVVNRTRMLKKCAFGVLKQWRRKQPMPKEMMRFIHHCATMIQAHFRGYRQRKYYRLFQPVLHRFQELLTAVAVGWKVRRVMKTQHVQRKWQKIKDFIKNNNLREARIDKRELVEDIKHLLTKGNWLSYCEATKHNKRKPKTTNIKLALGSKSSSHRQKQSQSQLGKTALKE